MANVKTPTTKTPRVRKPAPVIDPASLVNLPGNYRLNEYQGAAYLGLSVHTLRQWRFRDVGPGYAKLGSSVRYTKDDLDAYLAQSSVRPQA